MALLALRVVDVENVIAGGPFDGILLRLNDPESMEGRVRHFQQVREAIAGVKVEFSSFLLLPRNKPRIDLGHFRAKMRPHKLQKMFQFSKQLLCYPHSALCHPDTTTSLQYGRNKRKIETPSQCHKTNTVHLRPRPTARKRPESPPTTGQFRRRPLSHSTRWRPSASESAAQYKPHRIHPLRRSTLPPTHKHSSPPRKGTTPSIPAPPFPAPY
jgi:hypothetical protein